MAAQPQPPAPIYEHRIFGCYVRREFILGNTVSVTHEVPDPNNANQLVPELCRTPRETEINPLVPRIARTKLKDQQLLFHTGGHALCDTNNKLHYAPVLMRTNQVNPGVTLCGFISPISQIYPVILDLNYGHNWTQRLALGLHFTAYWDRYPINLNNMQGLKYNDLTVNANHYQGSGGLRIFFRYQTLIDNTQPITPDNIRTSENTSVSELREEFLIDPNMRALPELPVEPDLPNNHTTEPYGRIAFYVCAGAKLVVLDEYHQVMTCVQHNRSLIQPGGLVVIDGTTLRCMRGLNRNQNNFDPIFVDYRTVIAGMGLDADKAFRINAIQNPVFFLGAIESKYNSVVWSICLARNRLPTLPNVLVAQSDGQEPLSVLDEPNGVIHRKSTTEFFIPDRGFIVAIEEWDTGLNEVIARHRYEQLHKGVTRLGNENDRSYQSWVDGNGVIHTISDFEIPVNEGIMNRIINAYNRDTNLEFNFTQLIQQQNANYAQPMVQKEYRFSTPFSEQGFQEYIAREIPPPPPAAYPPVRIGANDYYLPNVLNYGNNNIEVQTVYDKYKVIEGKVCIDLDTEGHLKLQPEIYVSEYLWLKVGDGNPYDWTMPIERIDMKLCVDGHWYQKKDIIAKGLIKTQFYQKGI